MHKLQVAVILLNLLSAICCADTGLVTHMIGKDIKSHDVVNILSPVLEMSCSETWSHNDWHHVNRENCVYRTAKKWLKIETQRYENGITDDTIVGLYIKRDQLPNEAAQAINLKLPLRYDQLDSCTTLLSYCALPEDIMYRANNVVFYAVLLRTTCVSIFANQNNFNSIYEIGITGGFLGDFRKIPATAKYRDQIKNLGVLPPSYTFKKLELKKDALYETPLCSVTNILGMPVINGQVKFSRDNSCTLGQNRKVVFCDYDSGGAITSSVQFVEYAASNKWLKVVSMKNGAEPERVIQVSIDVQGYKNESLSTLSLPAPLSSYSSPNASDGETWMECPNWYEYDICAKKNGCPTWMSYLMRNDGEFELETLFFSQGNISPRYSHYSAYLFRSAYKLYRFFILPGAHEKGGLKNWE